MFKLPKNLLSSYFSMAKPFRPPPRFAGAKLDLPTPPPPPPPFCRHPLSMINDRSLRHVNWRLSSCELLHISSRGVKTCSLCVKVSLLISNNYICFAWHCFRCRPACLHVGQTPLTGNQISALTSSVLHRR